MEQSELKPCPVRMQTTIEQREEWLRRAQIIDNGEDAKTIDIPAFVLGNILKDIEFLQGPKQSCGHSIAWLIASAETGEPLYCDICNTRSELRDALQMEAVAKFEIARLTDCLKIANAHTEEFERKWYLAIDEIAELKGATNE